MLDAEVINTFMIVAGLSGLVFNRFWACIGTYLHFPRPNDLREARKLEGVLSSTSKAGPVGFILLGLCGLWFPFTVKLGEAMKPALLLFGLGSLMSATVFLGRLRVTAVSLTKEQFQELLHRKVTERSIDRLVLIARSFPRVRSWHDHSGFTLNQPRRGKEPDSSLLPGSTPI